MKKKKSVKRTEIPQFPSEKKFFPDKVKDLIIFPYYYLKIKKIRSNQSKKNRHKKTGLQKLSYKHIIILFLTILATISYFVIFKDLPSPSKLTSGDIPLATKIYDRNNILLYDIFVEQNRTPVPLSQMPEKLRQATIAIEDKNFYSHQGINPIGGILRAFIATITGKQLQGGSTITQQLVKSALLTPERSIPRKLKEMVLAFWVEILYPKDKILELYLNQVPYGGTSWGVETAAEKYFGKNVRDLSLAESALLAGLPQAPTLYSPFGSHPELSKKRQKDVLRRMVEDKYITKEEAEIAEKEELVFIKPKNILAPHFVMYVKEKLVEKFGEEAVEYGGLKVLTTLDIKVQQQSEATVSAEVDKLTKMRVGNGAALITKPATGEILAMVGSTDYFATPSGSYNVVTAFRQPGSSIKPINFAIGIENRIVTPSTMFLDLPTCFSSVNQPLYCPKNYDGKFRGPVQLRFALGNSLNIPAVKMLYLNSVSAMVASASAFGLDTYADPSKYGLSLTLGGGEVYMTDMAEAFGVFANGGIRKDLNAILKVTDKNGTVLYENKDSNINKDIPSQMLINGPRTISRETAYLISHILLDDNARADAFGRGSKLVIPGHTVSVKTGTTDDLRDNWTIGFTPTYLVATWVGNNDNSPMNPYLVSGVTGAAPIWNKLMTELLKNKPDQEPVKPDGITGALICTSTGLLPPGADGLDKGCDVRYEFFIKDALPQRQGLLTKSILIDKNTGNMATKDQTENLEPQEKTVLNDGMSEYCLDCNHDNEKPIIIK